MLKLKVKTAWNGMVAIRDKYLYDAAKKGLVIEHDRMTMTLKPEEVGKSIVQKSEFRAFNRYGHKMHYLVYFNWKPDKEAQPKLL